MVYNKIIAILPLFFIELAAVVSLLSFRDNFPVSLKRLSIVWLFMFAVEIAGHITGIMHLRNFWLYNLFDIIFLLSLASIYYYLIKSRMVKVIIRIFCIAFPLFGAVNIIFIQKLVDYNSLNYVCGGAFMVLLAAAYFWQLYASEETERITRDPFFWFSTGFLVYFGFTIPYLGMYNWLVENYLDFTKFYQRYIYVFFSIMLNILITVGFLCRKSYPKTY